VRDRVRVGARGDQQPPDRLLPGRGPQQVVGVQVEVAPLRGLGGGFPDELTGLFGHQLPDVDALRPSRRAVEAGEEVVERAGAMVARAVRVVDHVVLLTGSRWACRHPA
jgi:hypothetical protein